MKTATRISILAVASLFLFSAMAWSHQKPAPDPCSLLSKAEIQTIVGTTVSDGKLNSANVSTGPVCEYKVGGMGVLNLFVRQGNAADSPDKMLAELKKRDVKTNEIKGIGDRSFTAEMGFGMLQLNTFKGSTYYIITLLIPGAPLEKESEVAQKLMQKVVGRN